MTAPIDLERIENYTNAATPGPWHEGLDGAIYSGGELIADSYSDAPEIDSIFIANARTDVPLMLAEIKRLRLIETAAKRWVKASANCKDVDEVGRIDEALIVSVKECCGGISKVLADPNL